jgi:Tfp pilus assembly protein FimV
MAMKSFIAFVVAAGSVAAVSAPAAELPSKNAKPAAPTANMEKCEINGEPGFRVGRGDTCLRISGYVSGQVSGGNIKPH